jgi:hypothetical protein
VPRGKRRPKHELDRPWFIPKQPGDTFADIWGRYWDAGPARTAYVIDLLLKRYRIDVADPAAAGWALAIALANEYVPAMQASTTPRGRRVSAASAETSARIAAKIAEGKTTRHAAQLVGKDEKEKARSRYRRRVGRNSTR